MSSRRTWGSCRQWRCRSLSNTSRAFHETGPRPEPRQPDQSWPSPDRPGAVTSIAVALSERSARPRRSNTWAHRCPSRQPGSATSLSSPGQSSVRGRGEHGFLHVRLGKDLAEHFQRDAVVPLQELRTPSGRMSSACTAERGAPTSRRRGPSRLVVTGRYFQSSELNWWRQPRRRASVYQQAVRRGQRRRDPRMSATVSNTSESSRVASTRPYSEAADGATAGG